MPKLGRVQNRKNIRTEKRDSQKQEAPCLDQELFGLYASICDNDTEDKKSTMKDSEKRNLQPLNLNK